MRCDEDFLADAADARVRAVDGDAGDLQPPQVGVEAGEHLTFRYDTATRHLDGTAVLTVRATQP